MIYCWKERSQEYHFQWFQALKAYYTAFMPLCFHFSWAYEGTLVHFRSVPAMWWWILVKNMVVVIKFNVANHFWFHNFFVRLQLSLKINEIHSLTSRISHKVSFLNLTTKFYLAVNPKVIGLEHWFLLHLKEKTINFMVKLKTKLKTVTINFNIRKTERKKRFWLPRSWFILQINSTIYRQSKKSCL